MPATPEYYKHLMSQNDTVDPARIAAYFSGRLGDLKLPPIAMISLEHRVRKEYGSQIIDDRQGDLQIFLATKCFGIGNYLWDQDAISERITTGTSENYRNRFQTNRMHPKYIVNNPYLVLFEDVLTMNGEYYRNTS